MIRIRIYPNDEVLPNGLVWYDNGMSVGTVIIEELTQKCYEDGSSKFGWYPVEVIEAAQ